MKTVPLYCTKASQTYAARAAFSLIELLAAIGILSMIFLASGPAFRALFGAGSVNLAASRLAQSVQEARLYASTNHTYVRVGMSEVTGPFGTTLMAVAVYSADGTLTQDSGADMSDPAKWPAVGKPLRLDDFHVDETLATNQAPALDIEFERVVAGEKVSFKTLLQFSPGGEARLDKDEPIRSIEVGIDRPAPRNGRNPFLLRISGINGSVNILRKGEGLP